MNTLAYGEQRLVNNKISKHLPVKEKLIRTPSILLGVGL